MTTQLVVYKPPLQAMEISIYYKRPVLSSMTKITQSKDSDFFIRAFIGDLSLDYKEYAWLITLTKGNGVLSVSTLSCGSVGGTIIPVHEIAQTALLMHASGIILIHCHPSGNLKPSHQDLIITDQIKKGLKLLEVNLLDHLIISSEGFFSFSDEGHIHN